MAKRGKASGAGEALVPPAPPPSERETLDASVTSLSGLNLDQLCLQWRNQLGGIAPGHLPRWLLMRVLAYRIQAAAFGDLDRTILRRLRDEALELRDARPFATRGPTTREGVGLKSGALLVREWKGRLERVMVLDDGYAWNGCVYRSLSQVAKAITGTNWNGHRFFGLKAEKRGWRDPTDGHRSLASLQNEAARRGFRARNDLTQRMSKSLAGKLKALTMNRYLPVSLRFHSLSSRSRAMVVTCSRALRRLQQ